MTEIYDGFNDWKAVQKEFETDTPEPEKVYLARYEGGGYEGSGLVLYSNDGKFYLNEASHCSCYGLEGTWYPEEYASKELFLECLKRRKFYDHQSFVDQVISILEAS